MNLIQTLFGYRQIKLYERQLRGIEFRGVNGYRFRQLNAADIEAGSLFKTKDRAAKFLQRLAQRHRCYGAIAEDGDVASYAWVSDMNDNAAAPPFTGIMRFDIPADAIYIWDCRTAVDHQKRGLYRECLLYCCDVEGKSTADRAFISADAANPPSHVGIGAAGFHPAALFHILRIAFVSLVRSDRASSRWTLVRRNGLLPFPSTSPPTIDHIELIGIGGAGKTTLLARMKRIEGAPSVTHPLRPTASAAIFQTLKLIARVWLRAPLTTSACLLNFGGRLLFSKLGYRLAASHATPCRAGTILADCGFLEPLITNAIYFSSRSNPIPMREIFDSLPRPGAVVVVECDTETAYGRFVAREKMLDRLEAWGGSDNLRNRFDQAADRCATIIQWCLKAGRAVERIDCTSELTDQQIVDLKNRLIRYRPSADANRLQPGS